ncbi:hypothetical protein OBBRIDRAFT_16813 [Obba rivulosa]|uniref:Uncharacterized protein n=1 Tax=Obba rivulosa TaxID=1052685 RepID=A0A8E2DVP1_9APHY|nr:hypothetical protein OBBRIDRAFT_16813 [Obba rivulosa]
MEVCNRLRAVFCTVVDDVGGGGAGRGMQGDHTTRAWASATWTLPLSSATVIRDDCAARHLLSSPRVGVRHFHSTSQAKLCPPSRTPFPTPTAEVALNPRPLGSRSQTQHLPLYIAYPSGPSPGHLFMITRRTRCKTRLSRVLVAMLRVLTFLEIRAIKLWSPCSSESSLWLEAYGLLLSEVLVSRINWSSRMTALPTTVCHTPGFAAGITRRPASKRSTRIGISMSLRLCGTEA